MNKKFREMAKGPYVRLVEDYLLPYFFGNDDHQKLLQSQNKLIENAFKLEDAFQNSEIYDRLLGEKLWHAIPPARNKRHEIYLPEDAKGKDICDAMQEASEHKYAVITKDVSTVGDLERTMYAFSTSLIGELDKPSYKKKLDCGSDEANKRCKELLGIYDKPSKYITDGQKRPIRKGSVSLLYGLPEGWLPENSCNNLLISSRIKGEGNAHMKILRKLAEYETMNYVLESLIKDKEKRYKIINPGELFSQLCKEDINARTYTLPSYKAVESGRGKGKGTSRFLGEKLIVNPLKEYMEQANIIEWPLSKTLKLKQSGKKNKKSFDLKARSNFPRYNMGNTEIHWQSIETLIFNNWLGEREGGKMPRTFFETQRIFFLPPEFNEHDNVKLLTKNMNPNCKKRLEKKLHKRYRKNLEDYMEKTQEILKATENAFKQENQEPPQSIERIQHSLKENFELIHDYKKRHNIQS
ncbi:MAG: hypothetical protein ACOCZQ_00980 [Nanoarchaeota archaeon]